MNARGDCIDDALEGNLALLELDAMGLGLLTQVRYSCRDRYEDGGEWSDLDEGRGTPASGRASLPSRNGFLQPGNPSR